MAFSIRNLIGVSSGSRKLSALESAFNENDGAFYGVQPFGLMDGRFIGMDNHIIHAPANFILTAVTTSGSATNVLQAATATTPPYMKLGTGTTASDSLQVQHARALTVGTSTLTAWDQFICKAGYNIHMKARIMVSTTVANCALLVGLTGVDTTLLAAGTYGFTDGVLMFKAGSSAVMNGIQRTSSTNTTTTITGATIVKDQWHDIEMKVTGRSLVEFWFDGVKVGETTVTNMPANTVTLVPSIAIATTAAATAVLNVQGFSVFQEGR